jgi:hypothetical protein
LGVHDPDILGLFDPIGVVSNRLDAHTIFFVKLAILGNAALISRPIRQTNECESANK